MIIDIYFAEPNNYLKKEGSYSLFFLFYAMRRVCCSCFLPTVSGIRWNTNKSAFSDLSWLDSSTLAAVTNSSKPAPLRAANKTKAEGRQEDVPAPSSDATVAEPQPSSESPVAGQAASSANAPKSTRTNPPAAAKRVETIEDAVSGLTPAGRKLVLSVAKQLAEAVSDTNHHALSRQSSVVNVLAERDLEVVMLRLELYRERRTLSRRVVVEEAVRFVHSELARYVLLTGSQAELPQGFNPVFCISSASRYLARNSVALHASIGLYGMSGIGTGIVTAMSTFGYDAMFLGKLSGRAHIKNQSVASMLSLAKSDPAPLTDNELALFTAIVELFELSEL